MKHDHTNIMGRNSNIEGKTFKFNKDFVNHTSNGRFKFKLVTMDYLDIVELSKNRTNKDRISYNMKMGVVIHDIGDLRVVDGGANYSVYQRVN